MMALKIRAELYVVLLIAVILIAYKVYRGNLKTNELKNFKSQVKSFKNIQPSIGTELSKINIQPKRSSSSRESPKIRTNYKAATSRKPREGKQKTLVTTSSKAVIKEFKLIWKKNGVIFYREIVPEGKPKLNILLLHGHSFTSATWVNLTTMNILASAGYRVIAMDLPHYGKSKRFKLKNETPVVLVKFLRKFISKANIASPVIISPSASGKYSLPFVTHAKVSGFVPIAVVGTDRLAQKEFKSFKAPTLILRGSRDNSLGKRSMETLRLAIPHSTTKIVEGAGHACYIDKPKVFHDILLTFLNNIVLKKSTT